MKLRASASFVPGYNSMRFSIGFSVSFSWSAWCCEKLAMETPAFFVTDPVFGVRLPSSRLRSVDLPAPFGPTRQTRAFASIERSTSFPADHM